jgi:hypothetical protein
MDGRQVTFRQGRSLRATACRAPLTGHRPAAADHLPAPAKQVELVFAKVSHEVPRTNRRPCLFDNAISAYHPPERPRSQRCQDGGIALRAGRRDRGMRDRGDGDPESQAAGVRPWPESKLPSPSSVTGWLSTVSLQGWRGAGGEESGTARARRWGGTTATFAPHFLNTTHNLNDLTIRC